MKTLRLFHPRSLFTGALTALVALITYCAAPSAFAADYYYDGNTNAAGFGTASGIWAAPTPGPLTGWSTDSLGATAIGSVTTSTNDLINFGTDSAGLAGGTITVSGTVESGNMRFGALSTGITLSGGTIVFTNAATIEFGAATPVNHTISSEIAGASSSLTKVGVGSLILTGSNSYSGATIISAGSISLGNVNCLASTSGLTLGGASPAILAGFGDITGVIIPGPITAADSGVNSTISFGRNTANAGTLTLSGGITGGAGNVIFTTPTANGANGGQSQIIALGSPGGYGGTTTITAVGNQFANTIRADVANALPVTTALTFSGAGGSGSGRTSTFDLNGFNQTLAGLANVTVPQRRNYVVTSPTAATLTISNTTDYAFGGANLVSGTTSRARIQGAIALTKHGSGTFTLGGTLTAGAAAQGNTFTGDTKILGGILVLGETISIQNSTLDTASSITGDAANGLRTTVTALTLGGLSGNKNLADVFETVSGGYGSVTALTLGPGAGVTPSYSGAIADGAAGMSLTKTGAGTQTLTGGNNWTGDTVVRAGKLAVTTIPTGTGALTVSNSATLAVTGGGSSWAPASLTVETCTLEFNNVNTTTAPLAPVATVTTPVTSVTVNVNSLAGSPTVGFQYALITNVTATTGYSLGLQPPGFAGSLVVSANTLYYQVSAINDIWTGTDAANPTFWNIATSTNWVGNALLNIPARTYAQNDAVLFDDTATTFAVAIQTNVTPSGVNFNNSTNAYTVTGSGANVIGGTGGLTKLGASQVTLLGGEHSYSGGTTISAGTLQLGDGTSGNDAALTNTPSLLNNGALIYNRGGNGSASYPISGNGTLTKSGAGTLTLLGTNTYIGATTISGGTLEIGGSGSLNNGSYAAAIANNGTLLYSSSAAQTFGGGISGTGAVTKTNTSVVTFSSGSTFSGQMTVENGTASTDSVANDNSGGPFGQSTLPVILGSPGNIGTIRFTTAIGNLFSSKKHTMASGGSGGFQVNNAATTIRLDGLINGGGGLIKSGPGALNLTAANSFTGPTTISSGVLSLANINALGGTNPGVDGTSVITIGTNATLRPTVDGMLVNAPITVDAAGATAVIGAPTFNPGAGVNTLLTINSVIGGTGDVRFNSILNANALNTVVLNQQNNYNGNTSLDALGGNSDSQIIVRLGTNNALPTNTVVTIDGRTGAGSGRFAEINLNGFNQTLAGLTNVTRSLRLQRVVNSDVSPYATLTIDNTSDFTFGVDSGANSGGFLGGGANGSVSAGATPGSSNGNNLGLTKRGSGIFTLISANTYAGATIVNGGILSLGNSDALRNSPLDTLNSVTGDASNGLQTTVTTLTLGGLTGNKDLTNVFTTTLGGYDTVTSLTLNPGSGATNAYSAVIADGTAGMTLTKTGAGTQILTGVQTYTGATAVNAGTLLVNSPGSLSASSAVTVNTNATLGGNGTIGGSVTAADGGNLAPGASVGTLAISGGLDVSAQATGKLIYELGATNASDKITVGGTLAIGAGLLGISDFVFTNVGGLQNGTYKLITSGAPVSGTLDSADLTNSIGSFAVTLQINGNDLELAVSSVSSAPSPTLLTNSVSGGVLSLSWPAGQGWRLQEQTNSRSVGLRTNWVYVTDTSVSSTNITVDKTVPTTFYRLVFP